MKQHFAEYGFIYAIGGAIGGIFLRFKRKMSFAETIGTILIAALFGWLVGVCLDYWTAFPNALKCALSAVCGVFADDLYKELLKLIPVVGNAAEIKINKGKLSKGVKDPKESE